MDFNRLLKAGFNYNCWIFPSFAFIRNHEKEHLKKSSELLCHFLSLKVVATLLSWDFRCIYSPITISLVLCNRRVKVCLSSFYTNWFNRNTNSFVFASSWWWAKRRDEIIEDNCFGIDVQVARRYKLISALSWFIAVSRRSWRKIYDSMGGFVFIKQFNAFIYWLRNVFRSHVDSINRRFLSVDFNLNRGLWQNEAKLSTSNCLKILIKLYPKW